MGFSRLVGTLREAVGWTDTAPATGAVSYSAFLSASARLAVA